MKFERAGKNQTQTLSRAIKNLFAIPLDSFKGGALAHAMACNSRRRGDLGSAEI
jgi:hypothetical protein